LPLFFFDGVPVAGVEFPVGAFAGVAAGVAAGVVEAAGAFAGVAAGVAEGVPGSTRTAESSLEGFPVEDFSASSSFKSSVSRVARRFSHHSFSLATLPWISSRRFRNWTLTAISLADWKMNWPQLGARPLA